MTQWAAQLASKVAQIGSLARTAQTFRTTYGSWLARYHGGMPIGLLAASAAIESSGRMVAGDANLGEYGFFQIAANTEKDFGVPAGLRTKPEGNIFLAGLEYNVEAQRLAQKYPAYVRAGSRGQWLLARLVFAIGRHGTDICLKHAIESGFMGIGQGFAGVARWADASGGVKIGSSEAGKVWYRIKLVEKVLEPVAALVAPGEGPGVPESVPPPPGVTYTLPKDVRGRIAAAGASSTGLVLVLVAVTVATVLALRA